MVRLTFQEGAETSKPTLKKRSLSAAKPEAEWRCVVVDTWSASGSSGEEVMAVVVVVEVKVRQWKIESCKSGSEGDRGLADGISGDVGRSAGSDAWEESLADSRRFLDRLAN